MAEAAGSGEFEAVMAALDLTDSAADAGRDRGAHPLSVVGYSVEDTQQMKEEQEREQ